MKQLNIRIVHTQEELQKALCVRSIVFIEGQNCPYTIEVDGLDLSAIHFLGTIGDEPVATARIRLFKDYVKIERLAVREAYRERGIGKEIFAFILNHIEESGYRKMVLHAQTYLLKFYEDFGFVKKGDLFLEANIEHYHMEKQID